ncbi:MAG: DUF2393 family protein [Sulfurimonas sp.]|jgi:hypothetical protein|nr:DUF2393 family protein [Sulfurimonadaceae bacterium]
MALNLWHYLFFTIIALAFLAATFFALRLKKNIPSVVFTNTLLAIIAAIVSIYIVDSATKKAKIYNLSHKRILNTEQIVFSGMVQNSGKYTIGKAELEIKLLNKGQFKTDIKAGEVFKGDSFFGHVNNKNNLSAKKPQHITQKFTIATELKAGELKHFTLYMPYPPYFSDFMEYYELKLH